MCVCLWRGGDVFVFMALFVFGLIGIAAMDGAACPAVGERSEVLQNVLPQHSSSALARRKELHGRLVNSQRVALIPTSTRLLSGLTAMFSGTLRQCNWPQPKPCGFFPAHRKFVGAKFRLLEILL